MDLKKFLLLALIFANCGGRLTDEERKKLHEGMSTMDIKRVSDADLQIAGMAYGQKVISEVEKNRTGKTDSIASAFGVKIYRLNPTDSALREIEKQLVDAYVTGANPQTAGENLQKVGDSLLYTKPLFKTNADGSQQFEYAVGVKIPIKTVVLSMPKP